jgi:hypothetical protein
VVLDGVCVRALAGVVESVMTPLLAAVLIFMVLAAVPLVAWWRADAWRRWLALAAVAFTLACSLPGFTTTPDGVLRDTIDYVPAVAKRTTWTGLFGACAPTFGWTRVPEYLLWRWTGTWLVERTLGLAWGCLVAVGVATMLEGESK